MLLSWANAFPRQAATLVERQANGNYRVQFAGHPAVVVTAADLAEAQRVKVVDSPPGSRWGEIVLTAFTKLKSREQALDFAATEWIYAGEIGSHLCGQDSAIFEIKREFSKPNGKLWLGPPISSKQVAQRLLALRGQPTVAYTNRRIHIWAVLNYDARRQRVYVRNPRRRSGVWMSLPQFVKQFQLLVYVPPHGTA